MLRLSELEIDQEFRDLLPPLSEDERRDLRDSIDDEGFRDPVIVWLHHNVIVDGHNRLDIWRTEHDAEEDDGPEIVEKYFASRDDVILWIIRNQLARRNLTDAQRIEVALKLKPGIAAKAKEQQVRKSESVSTNSTEQKPIDTRAEIAKAAGVSQDSVRKVEAVLTTGTPELQQAMRSSAVSINTAAKAAKLEPEQQAEVVEAAQVSKQAAVQVMQESTPEERRRDYQNFVRRMKRAKSLTDTDVHALASNIEKSVKQILARVKCSSRAAIAQLPSLSRQLRDASKWLADLADDVDAKQQEAAA